MADESTMSYWYADEKGYQNLSKTIKRPTNYQFIGLSTFCDINDDEKIDHLLPVCKNKNQAPCSILMYDEKRQDWIVLVKEVKVGDVEYYFSDFHVFDHQITLPTRVRHGFVGDNGFTDLMALMRRKGGESNEAHVVIFYNRKSHGNSEITFEISALNETKETRPFSASFFDLYEDGVFDIFVGYEVKNASGTYLELRSLTLKEFAAANFVKVLVTSGLCSDGGCFEKR